MIKNYLTIAWRNLLKHKTFSLINVLGLATGLAVCMIIFLYVHNELTYDAYNSKADRIARITTTITTPESDLVMATSSAPLATTLEREFPQVERAARLESAPRVVKLHNEFIKEPNFYLADKNIFSVFDFHFIEGSAGGALTHPNTAVITESIARKYFGKAAALGKTITCNDQDILVTGVVQDRPANSDMLIHGLLYTDFSIETSWIDDLRVYTFVLLKPNTILKDVERAMAVLGTKYVQPELDAVGAKEYHARFDIEPLTEVHFSKGKMADMPKGNKQFNYIFSILAVLVLVIALLNYINLSTARSAERAKEVGIRKVSGARPFQLIRQFIFESLLLITIACILGILLVGISLPFFNTLLQTQLSVNFTQGILLAAAVFIITILLAGLYPAFVLSAFRPAAVLKGTWRNSFKGVWLRKTVTVAQFAIAAALIMGTAVIYSQMKFIEQRDLGFNKSQLLNIYLPRDTAWKNAANMFRNELRQRPEIAGLTIGAGMTADELTIATTFTHTEGRKKETMCNYYVIDPEFLPVFQIPLLSGRNLSDSFSTDKKEAFLVNEAFVKKMGWTSAIGQPIEGMGHKGKVVGVVKNFYYKSLHNLVEPLVMIYNTSPANTITVKINPRDLPVVKQLFKKSFPTQPLHYSFFDDIVNKQYRKDRTMMSLFTGFTILAIFICCLGLYGLVNLMAVHRLKEVSIRKVLGASLPQLLSLLTKDFVKLLLVALILAMPVIGILMNKWLHDYAYHASLQWWMFLIPASLLLVITLTVIGREIIKMALTNPVKHLKAE